MDENTPLCLFPYRYTGLKFNQLREDRSKIILSAQPPLDPYDSRLLAQLHGKIPDRSSIRIRHSYIKTPYRNISPILPLHNEDFEVAWKDIIAAIIMEEAKFEWGKVGSRTSYFSRSY